MKKSKGILSKGTTIENKYTVTFFLKKGTYAETYRIKDDKGKIRILKLISYAKLDKTQFAEGGEVLEVEILKTIDHHNLVSFHDSGEVVLSGQKFIFLVLNYISGETLADKMKREHTLNPYVARDMIEGVLNGLNYLHSLTDPIIHNDITNLNVMSDLASEEPVPKIIDYGYARFLSQPNSSYNRKGLNPFYLAPESFNRVFSVQTDIFSVGALYYHILFGLPPWFVEISMFSNSPEKLEQLLSNERRKPLKILETDSLISPETMAIINKALNPDPDLRFRNVAEFLKALNGEIKVENISNKLDIPTTKKGLKQGDGFKAIAGMEDLKILIKYDVIDAFNDRERYAEYGLTIPNGMLLYGPPGCGKTFFAEKLAEEIGFDFFEVKPSDIQSKWVNQSQENISELFKEAINRAPSIIFIDELDAVVPNRNNTNINHMNTSAVNEFLAQMNNSGEKGIFIIGATNRPDSIDPAILRSGRLDKVIYLPPPDFEARKLMFELYLDKRPREVGLDYTGFAENTKNFVSSDIKFLCDEASRKALIKREKISNDIILKTISENRPSVSENELNYYVDIQSKLEGEKRNNNKRPKIGFR
jgi:transitional endoplasmic reticulum ATPase